jgi:hypothetical protein
MRRGNVDFEQLADVHLSTIDPPGTCSTKKMM